MARPWSARCYGVARQRDGSRQNSIGGLRRAFSPAFRAGSLYPLARGCRTSWRGEGCNYGLWLRRRRRRFRFQLAEGDPRLSYLSPLAREGAAGQAVVCPLLRGSSPTRGVAPKQHRGLRRAFSPAFRAGSLYPLARGCRRIWRGEVEKYGFGGAVADFVVVISGSRRRPRRSQGRRSQGRGQLRHDPIATARCCSTGSGRLDLDLLNLDLLISGPRVYLIYHPYARIWRGEGYNYGLWLRQRRRRFRFQLAEGAPRLPYLSPLRARGR